MRPDQFSFMALLCAYSRSYKRHQCTVKAEDIFFIIIDSKYCPDSMLCSNIQCMGLVRKQQHCRSCRRSLRPDGLAWNWNRQRCVQFPNQCPHLGLWLLGTIYCKEGGCVGFVILLRHHEIDEPTERAASATIVGCTISQGTNSAKPEQVIIHPTLVNDWTQ